VDYDADEGRRLLSASGGCGLDGDELGRRAKDGDQEATARDVNQAI
jgi:hypothetical protein